MRCFRTRYVRRVLVPVMAVSVLSACHQWKVQEMTPSQVVSEKEPGKIRLTMLDGDRIQIGDPMVANGEIVGHPVRRVTGHNRVIRSDTVRVVADSVSAVEIRQTDAFATGIGVLFGIVAAAGVAILIALSEWDGPFGGG